MGGQVVVSGNPTGDSTEDRRVPRTGRQVDVRPQRVSCYDTRIMGAMRKLNIAELFVFTLVMFVVFGRIGGEV
jgi:hypothetical protein